jgi:hypothetical protein
MARSQNVITHDGIGQSLRKAISDLSGDTVIRGALTVSPGHSYWWFLEYGTGVHREAPDGTLIQPSETKGESPEGGPYEIKVKDAKVLVYMTSDGVRRFAKSVMHPGVKPIGFLRTAHFEAQLMLKEELKTLSKGKKGRVKFLSRAELVEFINALMEVLLTLVKIYTPDNNDPDPLHEGRRAVPLAEAWDVRKAT